MNIKEIIDKAYEKSNLCQEEIVEILKNEEEDNIKYLFKKAEQTTLEYCGNEVNIRGIIEFSNYCRCNCSYCGLNVNNKKIKRYRMTKEEILKVAKEAYNAGYKTLVLQSGEDLFYTREVICDIIKSIKEIGDIAITLSIGKRDKKDYRAFKKAGGDRFLIKHETADENLFSKIHKGYKLEDRIQALKDLKEVGFQAGSGFMIGLPTQDYNTLAKDILLLKELDVDMAGMGPFIPHPHTELKHEVKGDTLLTLKVVALSRIILKNVHLPATTSLGVLNKDHKFTSFKCGANVIMQKLEPYNYRRLYEIYPIDLKKEKSIIEEREDLEKFILSSGRDIAKHRGDTLKKERF
ncbi:[FeFe] hydrogenase H-cluster radical SAM maturase HydE [Clostridium cochlearium]|uniref:[FeFe] hydrogenase H-cluster radical SAM maturase HydE n=1 Tax=Clostridium cochlearium TaxID=1494 RepID=UPI00214A3B45|nr:[FeFe] hydrogenase H-cluster radical SAM maturase HydE [Clostridium cochlearium]MCR1970606.1 [FeFe] hydrogenase H-cluster radical SAM maturase HydE [Clostridium cochlearium]